MLFPPREAQIKRNKELNTLFDAHYESLCVASLRIIDSYEKAEDIVQDIFIKIWEKQLLNGNNDNIAAYLYRAVKNNSLQYLRDNKRYKHESIEQLASNLYTEEENLDLEEENNYLLTEITKLSPQAQKVFKSIIFNDMKYKEVAEELNISVNTVKTTYSRSLKRLRSCTGMIILFI